MKKILFFLFVVITNIFLVGIIFNKGATNQTSHVVFNNEAFNLKNKNETTSKVVKYKKINIKSLYVRNKNGNNVDRIKWYKKGGNYILFLPKNVNREKLYIDFEVENKEVDAYLSIYNNDGKLVSKIKTGNSVNLTNDEYVFAFDTDVYKSNSYKVKIMQSNVGAVFINLTGGAKDYKKVYNSVNNNYATTGTAVVYDEDGKVIRGELEKFKGRGNATWKREKKPFMFKFEKKKNLANMGNAKSWVLLANHWDGPLSRNYIWYHLGIDLGLQYTSNCEPVELYVNNEYLGSYLLSTKPQARSTRVDIDVENGDYLIQQDFHPDKNRQVTKHGMKFIVEDPNLDKLEKEEVKKIKKDALDLLNNVEKLIYSNASYEELSKYLDYESFAKYYLVNEISLNYDAARGSVYMYFKDGKLYAGPLWDMDATMNRSIWYAPVTGIYLTENASLLARQDENWYKILVRRNDFSNTIDRIFVKYKYLFENLDQNILDYDKRIRTSAKMNYTKYPYKKMINDQVHPWIAGNNSYDSSVRIFANNTKKRVNYYLNMYNKITIDKLIYKVTLNNKIIAQGDIIQDACIKLPSDIDKNASISIYSVKNNTEKLEKTYDLSNNVISDSIKYESKTKAKNKRVNRYVYKYTLVVPKEV